MPSTVFVNGRGVVHTGSGGMSIAFPNVCKTPTPPGVQVPLPYPSIGESKQTSPGPKRVKIQGQMPMVKGAKYPGRRRARDRGRDEERVQRRRGRVLRATRATSSSRGTTCTASATRCSTTGRTRGPDPRHGAMVTRVGHVGRAERQPDFFLS